CGLTTLIFPYLYGIRNPIQTVTYDWAFMPVVAIRNLLLLSFTLRAILSAEPSRLAGVRADMRPANAATEARGSAPAPDDA
ncbi:MAG TPA: hypothetical protein VFX31_09825, partial [Ktedonobacterales bacterium]|nr:hypothetical protein [Ktedonobacterales bacterium]